MIFISLFLLLLGPLWAQDADYGMKNPEFAYVYQQDKFQETDLLGDILLAHSAQKAQLGLLAIMVGKRGEYYSGPYIRAYEIAREFPQLSRANGEDAVYLPNLPVHKTFYILDLEKMKTQFKKILIGKKITEGKIPNWSKEFRNKYKNRIFPALTSSKLLTCLIRGACSRFLYTGFEQELESWAMTQDDLSITPPRLLSKALELTHGNMAMALLASQNTLSWHSKANERWMTQLQSKLMPFITIKGEKSEDKFGEWYHMFGLMTYSFEKGNFRTSLIARVESLGGRVLGNKEVVEEDVNTISGELGSFLKEELKKLPSSK